MQDTLQPFELHRACDTQIPKAGTHPIDRKDQHKLDQPITRFPKSNPPICPFLRKKLIHPSTNQVIVGNKL